MMNATTRNGTRPPAILVVEDFEPLRFSVVTWLKYRFPGCVVQGVASAEEALQHARAHRPEVVLMDINLPGMNGLEATCRMKEQAPETAVVMLTTHDTPHHRLAAANAGAKAYVAKHEMETQLEAAVRSLLGSRWRTAS
jgi:two-component system nitrate/nitrite response regulator NarL